MTWRHEYIQGIAALNGLTYDHMQQIVDQATAAGDSGFLAGIMGVIYIAGTNSVNPVSLVGTEMSVIACVVIGGAAPSGGYGKIFGTILGVILYYLFNQTLIYLGLSASWQDFFMGIVLLFSIISTSYQRRLKDRKNFIFTE